MTEYQLQSVAGRSYLPNIKGLFDKGINVPPSLAARLSVEIARVQARLSGAASSSSKQTDTLR